MEPGTDRIHRNMDLWNATITNVPCFTSEVVGGQLHISNDFLCSKMVIFKPFMLSGLFYHNSLGQSISNGRVFIITMFYRNLPI